MEIKITRQEKKIPFEKKWQFCVGSGQALLALRHDYTEQLKYVHEELGIERVRFHGILNDDMKIFTDLSDILPFPGGERFHERTFRQCGMAYDNVLAAGMKPFVELSFLPSKLAVPSDGESFVKGASLMKPVSPKAWADYVCDFISYLMKRYGKEEVETWYFEVWNEPDLQGAFFYGTQKDYFELYEAAARAIKKLDPKLQVGGPSTSASKWVAPFVKYCKEHDVPLDFVTTHQYSGDPLIGVTDDGEKAEVMDVEKMMADLGQALAALPDGSTPLDALRATLAGPSQRPLDAQVFRKNAKVAKEEAEGLPLYYTEWNANATFAAYDNDTRLTAAYDVVNALATDGTVDGSSIWCFSDIFDEMHMFAESFHGGFGMLTIDGIPKPVFQGMKMLAMAGDVRLDLGEDALNQEICTAAFEKEGKLQLLLVRQKMTQEDLPKEKVSVTVSCEKEPESVTLYRIDEDHVNPLKLWEADGKPAELNAAEIARYKEAAKLVPEKMAYAYEDGCLRLEAELGMNDLYFIEIA